MISIPSRLKRVKGCSIEPFESQIIEIRFRRSDQNLRFRRSDQNLRFRRSDQALIRSLKLKKADRRDYFTAHKVKSQFFFYRSGLTRPKLFKDF